MLFHLLRPLQEPALIFLLRAPFVGSVGMLMPLQRLFFVSREPDTECLHPVLLTQLVQPCSQERGSLLRGTACVQSSHKILLVH